MATQSAQFARDTLARVGRLKLSARRIVEGARVGIHRSPLHGTSVEFAEHKEYTPGDELRNIDWKLFGKLDKYYVKKFEEETNLLAYLLLDTSASMGFGGGVSGPRSWWRQLGEGRRSRGRDDQVAWQLEDAGPETTKHRYATLLAASLAYLLIGQGDSVGLFPFGRHDARFILPRSGSQHLSTLMATLADATPAGVGHIAEALADFAPRVKRRSLIILVSDLLEAPEAILQAMKTLRTRRNDVVVFHVMHTDELTFPFRDVSRFEDPEDREKRLVADPREVREGYLEELERFLDKVRSSCFEAQVDYNLIDTSRPVATTLADFLTGRTFGMGGRY